MVELSRLLSAFVRFHLDRVNHKLQIVDPHINTITNSHHTSFIYISRLVQGFHSIDFGWGIASFDFIVGILVIQCQESIEKK